MKKLMVIGIIILMVGVSIPSTGIKVKKSNASFVGNTYYVGGIGPGNYSKIQDAIDNTTDGDTIFVFNGTYYENVIIDKSINLIGEDKETTIIEGSESGNFINISADWVNISGFTIRNSGGLNNTKKYAVGIKIHSNHNSIMYNIISGNHIGINLVETSSYNIISNNNITSNKYDGIDIDKSNNNKIMNNNIKNNDYGISHSYSNYNTFRGNNIISNSIDGMWIWGSCKNIIIGNNITSNDYDGIDIFHSDNNIISDNNISLNKDIGISLNECKFNNISDNDITYNEIDGIFLSFSSNNNIIKDNNITSNEYNGIELYEICNKNIISGNKIASNKKYGMQLKWNSNSNTIIENNFFNDSLFVYDSYHNKVENNNVNDKPLVYLEDESDKTITNAGQVILVNCNNILVENTNLSNIDVGIELWGANNCKISNNECSNNHRVGIYLYESSSNTITSNSVISNEFDGIVTYSSNFNNISRNNVILNNKDGINLDSGGITLRFNSNNNIISGNKIALNMYHGIKLGTSNNNTIYHNNFIDNYAEDNWNNLWDDGEFGNYWSDYRTRYPYARRLWVKGIWDTPYAIYGDGGNKDNCPLIKQWTNVKSRELPENTASYSFYKLRFLERFSLLREVLAWIIDL